MDIVKEVWFCYDCLNPQIKWEFLEGYVKDIFGEVVEEYKEVEAIDVYCNECQSNFIAHATLSNLDKATLEKVSDIIYDLYHEYDGQANGHWEIPFFVLLLHAHNKSPLEICIIHNGINKDFAIAPSESVKRLKEHAKHLKPETVKEIIEKYEKLFGKTDITSNLKEIAGEYYKDQN